MIPDCVGQPRLRVLQVLSFLLCQVRFLQFGKDVSEFSLQLLEFCAKHGGLRFLPLSLGNLAPN